MLTQETLKSLLHYCPDTGVFTNIKARQGARAGAVFCALNGQGYISISIYQKKYKAHRLAWLYVNGTFPQTDIDHINRNRADNRICNLRLATNAENHQNKSMHSNNTSGHIGVCWDIVNNKWYASIRLNYKHIFLGRFTELHDAIAARKQAELQYHPFKHQALVLP